MYWYRRCISGESPCLNRVTPLHGRQVPRTIKNRRMVPPTSGGSFLSIGGTSQKALRSGGPNIVLLDREQNSSICPFGLLDNDDGYIIRTTSIIRGIDQRFTGQLG